MSAFKLSRAVLSQIEELARQGFPREICGFVAGPAVGQGSEIKPARNIASQPSVEYKIAPEETLSVLLATEGRGLRLTGVYHSHPRYPAQPSGTDLHLADLPDACYLITSVWDSPKNLLECETRAWKIEHQQAFVLELVITD